MLIIIALCRATFILPIITLVSLIFIWGLFLKSKSLAIWVTKLLIELVFLIVFLKKMISEILAEQFYVLSMIFVFVFLVNILISSVNIRNTIKELK